MAFVYGGYEGYDPEDDDFGGPDEYYDYGQEYDREMDCYA